MEIYYKMISPEYDIWESNLTVVAYHFAMSIFSICLPFLLFEFLLWTTMVPNTKLPALMFSANYGYMVIFKPPNQARFVPLIWETKLCRES